MKDPPCPGLLGPGMLVMLESMSVGDELAEVKGSESQEMATESGEPSGGYQLERTLWIRG